MMLRIGNQVYAISMEPCMKYILIKENKTYQK